MCRLSCHNPEITLTASELFNAMHSGKRLICVVGDERCRLQRTPQPMLHSLQKSLRICPYSLQMISEGFSAIRKETDCAGVDDSMRNFKPRLCLSAM